MLPAPSPPYRKRDGTVRERRERRFTEPPRRFDLRRSPVKPAGAPAASPEPAASEPVAKPVAKPIYKPAKPAAKPAKQTKASRTTPGPIKEVLNLLAPFMNGSKPQQPQQGNRK